VSIIVNNLWRRKGRTLLTMLGVAAGVAAVIALSAFGEGMANGMQRISSSSAADLTVQQSDAVMTLLSAVDQEVGEQIAQLSGVAEVSGTVVGVVQM
jgi:ABC-type antimicrobial peptide transport system permease subunit